MRFQFILSEINIGLRRNVTMTVSVILVTTVSLLLLGVGVLAQKQVLEMKGYWYDRVQVSIFLCGKDSNKTSCGGGEVTDAQRQAISVDLQSPQLKKYVAQVYYESKEKAFTRFKKQYPDLAENLTADTMPESYRVRLINPQQYAAISQQFRNKPGVDTRAGPEPGARPVVRTAQRLEVVRLVRCRADPYLLGAAGGDDDPAQRVHPPPRDRHHAARRRLEPRHPTPVRAGEPDRRRWSGAVIASGILMAFTQFAIQGWLKGTLKFIDNWVSLGDAVLVMPWMFLLGMLIAGVSSFLSLRRYLKV